MKFVNKLKKFMYGRYGSDDLSLFLMKLYIVLFIISIFIKSSIVSYIELIVFVIIFYRMLSKNIYNRRKENDKFISIKNKLAIQCKGKVGELSHESTNRREDQ